MSDPNHVAFKATEPVPRRLDQLAERHGMNRSAAITEATRKPSERPVADQAELLVLLSEAARAGSVPAMRELLAFHRTTRRKPGGFDVLDELDELAVRRDRMGEPA